MSVKDWLSQYDNQRKLMMITFILLVAAPFIRPLSLPVPITQPTRMFYDEIQNIQSGDIIVVDFNFAASNWGELGAGSIALLKQLIAKRATTDFKVVFLATMESGPYMLLRSLDAIGGWPAMNLGEYGEDWVSLGFMAGGEPMTAAMASNFNSIYRTDDQGTPVEELPLLTRISTVEDIEMVIHFNMGGDSDKYRKQWGVPFGVKVLQVVQGIHVPTLAMYLSAGQVQGYIASIRGAAEYELLIGRPGEAIVSTDALSMSHLMVIAVIVAGNLVYFLIEKKEVP
jgi:hypothetical protein